MAAFLSKIRAIAKIQHIREVLRLREISFLMSGRYKYVYKEERPTREHEMED